MLFWLQDSRWTVKFNYVFIIHTVGVFVLSFVAKTAIGQVITVINDV